MKTQSRYLIDHDPSPEEIEAFNRCAAILKFEAERIARVCDYFIVENLLPNWPKLRVVDSAKVSS